MSFYLPTSDERPSFNCLSRRCNEVFPTFATKTSASGQLSYKQTSSTLFCCFTSCRLCLSLFLCRPLPLSYYSRDIYLANLHPGPLLHLSTHLRKQLAIHIKANYWIMAEIKVFVEDVLWLVHGNLKWRDHSWANVAFSTFSRKRRVFIFRLISTWCSYHVELYMYVIEAKKDDILFHNYM